MDLRVVFSESPDSFFNAIKSAHGGSWQSLADAASVSVRTLTSWRTRDTAMPVSIARQWSRRCNVAIPAHTIMDLDEKRLEAASKGGIARQEKYGNLGTPAGRKLGGHRASKMNRKNPLSPFVARKVRKPRVDARLAELIGVALGDGALTEYQLVIYSNSADESAYADFLHTLVRDVFGLEPSIVREKTRSIIKVICSRKHVVTHLLSFGLATGNKVTRQARVPAWIRRNRELARACVRGLVDTDGCVYHDTHRNKGKEYVSACIVFTNASVPLLDFVEDFFKKEGFTPTRWGRHVRLRRQKEVRRYVKEIGFHNPKHRRKIRV